MMVSLYDFFICKIKNNTSVSRHLYVEICIKWRQVHKKTRSDITAFDMWRNQITYPEFYITNKFSIKIPQELIKNNNDSTFLIQASFRLPVWRKLAQSALKYDNRVSELWHFTILQLSDSRTYTTTISIYDASMYPAKEKKKF